MKQGDILDKKFIHCASASFARFASWRDLVLIGRVNELSFLFALVRKVVQHAASDQFKRLSKTQLLFRPLPFSDTSLSIGDNKWQQPCCHHQDYVSHLAFDNLTSLSSREIGSQ